MTTSIQLSKMYLGRDIILTPIQSSDTRELFQATIGNRDHLRDWLPWLDQIVVPGDTRAYIRAMRRLALEGEGFAYVIRERARIVGMIDMHHLDRRNNVASIGYWLSSDAQGRGIMTDACRAVVQFGFEHLELNRIEIRCAAFNLRSRAIPERLLFTEEGCCRQAEWLYDHYVDHIVYAMLAFEWRIINATHPLTMADLLITSNPMQQGSS